MEISPWLVYLVLKLDAIQMFFIACAVLLLMFCGGRALYLLLEESEPVDGKPFLAVAVFLLVGLLIPSTKDVLLVYGIPSAIKGQVKAIEELNGTPLKVAKLVNQYLDEAISAGKEDKGREKEND